MKQTLINKYLAGETNISEERELRQLLLDTPATQRSKAERSILELLSYSESEEMEEDIFAVDYTEEYDKHLRPSRTIRLWPCLAAACVAALLIVFLAPPKAPQPPKGESSIALTVKDSVMLGKPKTNNPKHLIADAEHKAPKDNEMIVPVVGRKAEPTHATISNKEKRVVDAESLHNELAVNSTETNEEVTSVANERMEEFYASSANIHRCGQQLMHRVATMQAEQNNNNQYVNL